MICESIVVGEVVPHAAVCASQSAIKLQGTFPSAPACVAEKCAGGNFVT